MTAVPFVVEPGWIRADILNGWGVTHRLLTYVDGTVRFEHRCDRGNRGVIICAPRLHPDHSISRDAADLPTVSPSVLCVDCGTHGFVVAGRWLPA